MYARGGRNDASVWLFQEKKFYAENKSFYLFFINFTNKKVRSLKICNLQSMKPLRSILCFTANLNLLSLNRAHENLFVYRNKTIVYSTCQSNIYLPVISKHWVGEKKASSAFWTKTVNNVSRIIVKYIIHTGLD